MDRCVTIVPNRPLSCDYTELPAELQLSRIGRWVKIIQNCDWVTIMLNWCLRYDYTDRRRRYIHPRTLKSENPADEPRKLTLCFQEWIQRDYYNRESWRSAGWTIGFDCAKRSSAAMVSWDRAPSEGLQEPDRSVRAVLSVWQGWPQGSGLHHRKQMEGAGGKWGISRQLPQRAAREPQIVLFQLMFMILKCT